MRESCDRLREICLACLAVLLVAGSLVADEPLAGASSPTETMTTGSAGDVLIVVGAPGTPEYRTQFAEWAAQWEEAAKAGDCRVHRIGDGGDSDNDDARRGLQQILTDLAKETQPPLWVVLIGHGTFDGRTARFNLAGADVSDVELGQWLEPLTRPVAVINCSSASGTFIAALSKPERVVITATRDGNEVNFARFGGSLARAIHGLAADLDKDGQVSLLEAFLMASRETTDFYVGDNRLVTEHALLDDNGDGRGTRAQGFDGTRPVRDAESGQMLDGYVARQWRLIPSEAERRFPPELRDRRDELEREVFLLRDRKEELTEDDYFTQLEKLLIELARLYEQADKNAK